MNSYGKDERKKAQEVAHKLEQRKNKARFAEYDIIRKQFNFEYDE